MGLLLLPACTASNGRGAETDTLAWRVDSLVRVMPECAADSIRPCAEVRLEWVVVTDSTAVADSVATEVERMILSSAGEGEFVSRDSMVASLFAGLRDFQRHYPDAPGGWFDQRTISVACNTPDAFVLRLDLVNFFGGAHPNSATVFASFDPRTGSRLDWRGADLARLQAVAERHFRAARELPDSGSLNAEGWQFAGDRFTLASQGMRCNGDVTLMYNPYEVGPYVLGATEFTIPATELVAR